MRIATLLLSAALGVAPAAGVLAAAKKAAAPAAKTGASGKYDETKLKELEAKLAKSPKDAKLKQEVAEASYQVGHYIEYDKPGLAPREKYGPALKLYRRALALNPGHAKAKFEKEQIEGIYKQMGRPIPQ